MGLVLVKGGFAFVFGFLAVVVVSVFPLKGVGGRVGQGGKGGDVVTV